MGVKQGKFSIANPVIDLPLEDQFIAMANTSPMLLWIAGIDKLCFFFNKVWLQFTGRTIEQELGNGWLAGVHPDDSEKCVETYDHSFSKHEGFKIEYRLRRYDGQYRWMLANGSPYRNKEQKFSGYFCSCVDINEIKELEKRKDQFITAASHELKTPVTSLSVYLHLISEYFTDKKEDVFGNYTKSAVEQVNKIKGLIDQLLDLSNIDANLLRFEWTCFNFGKFIQSIVEKTQLNTPSHTIELQGSSLHNIRGDKERLSQVMENLLMNAIKYSNRHNKIVVKLSENTKHVQVSVIDYGIGIDKDYLPQVFDRFYRIPGTKEETFPGMGIGLYLSKQIIDKHSGKIWGESVKNKETAFNFQIPVFVTK